ncbi:MAG TPA: DUF4325 domain-containing protein [Candidatus Paceibacterota bacterium]
MKLSKETILNILEQKKQLKTRDLVSIFGVSRQYISFLLKQLVNERKIVKTGSTSKASYLNPKYAANHLELFPNKIKKTLKNKGLEEHKVLNELENKFPLILTLKENVRSIFTYAFSEMLNNAIEHSKSKNITVEVRIENKKLFFDVIDSGIGVYKNIMVKRTLKSELEAIQDLLKGKTTTQPKSHSGEGIFFTSRAGDLFNLDSFGYRLVIVNNRINDVFLQKPKAIRKGTKVSFSISIDSDRHLNDIFRKYTGENEDGYQGFDKTEVKIKLYTIGGVFVSRSQARRVLSGLDKFKSVVFDFDKVPMIGQAFADEIFRVFHNNLPDIKLQFINTNEAVKFMIERVEKNKSHPLQNNKK